MTRDNSDAVGLSALPADEGDGTFTPVVLLLRGHLLECRKASQNEAVNHFGALIKGVVLFAKLGLQLTKEKGLATGRHTIQSDNGWFRNVQKISLRRSIARQVTGRLIIHDRRQYCVNDEGSDTATQANMMLLNTCRMSS